ncbi:MAG: hypothetical protein Unbinned5081contig1003_47 [Prokaryotic dsDNA virus sp.]|nr:MAG: hypothetical protein Unbinned5081contig1003_47 [Prokaryotic dsDNA virus sp.]|tara:strand:- start:26252 stop:26695 length:444 start_codon:yes stop_codon:yes gene_type:complete
MLCDGFCKSIFKANPMYMGSMKTFAKNLKKTSEHDEQVQIFKWAKLNESKFPELWLLNASLNGVRLNIGQASKAKRSGMKSGYPDISLPVPRGKYHGYYQELKIKGNYPTKEQKEWLKNLSKQGYKCDVCYGAQESIQSILKYLKEK